nr:MAG TPA: hypothetical protein [Herelleviridae sp.]
MLASFHVLNIIQMKVNGSVYIIEYLLYIFR